MSALWAVADVARAVGAKTNKEWCAWRVEIDSRKVQAGDLFVAIKGDNFDGHDFVEKAFAAGAIAAIVEKKLDCGGNQLIVSDCKKALDDLAKYNRLRIHNLGKAKIIGITGSVGKTSTKEMLRLALSAHGKVYATSGNYNNHIGTPLTLANMPLDANYGIFEMGMNHTGEISHLTNLVCPHVAMVTRVEAAHLEFFAGIEEIAAAKAEIFEGLFSSPSPLEGEGGVGGIAIINADQPYFHDLFLSSSYPPTSGHLKTQTPSVHPALDPRLRGDDSVSAITFGENEKANCRLLKYETTGSGCQISAEIFSTPLSYTLAAVGKHWATVSLSVLAVVHALGLDIQKSAQALAAFSEVEGRGKIITINLSGNVAGGTATLIDDSYNASPTSMRAAFAKTAEVWQAQGRKGRKVAILGKMLELGDTAPAIHAELASDLVKHGFDIVYSAGDLMQHMHQSLPDSMRGAHTLTATELLPLLALRPDDVILLKGSHGSKIYELAEKIAKTATHFFNYAKKH